MLSRAKKFAIAGACTGALMLGTGTAAFAANGADTGDHFSLAAGTVVTSALKSGTKVTFKGSIDGVAITVTCTTFTASGKIPATGLTVPLSAPPTISGCKDTLGGTDTVKTNTTNGKWKLREKDVTTTADSAEPNSGDKAILTIPKAGATFVSSFLPTCTVTTAPSGPANVTGTYDDINTIQDTNASIPTSGSGCTTTAASETATVVLSPNVHDT
jgi:hypothetical protein